MPRLLLAVLAWTASTAYADPSQIRLATRFNPLHHLSAISPYFSPHPDVSNLPPPGCVITRASLLVRHTSITANDDEFDETMGPFISKLSNLSSKSRNGFRAVPSLAFLSNWSSPVNQDNLEQATDPGRADARALGERCRRQYEALAPGKLDNYSVWTASSSRDIETAKAWIQGALPDHAGEGTGDGHVRLVEVPNKDPDWAASLTPHKICPRFSKTRGKPARDSFRRHFATPAADKLNSLVAHSPASSFNFTWVDVVGMIQLCGYETVIRGASPLCAVFSRQDFESWSFGEDLFYHIISGYGQPWVPVVGMPWLSLSALKLSQPHPPHPDDLFSGTKTGTSKLPRPTTPPEETNGHQSWNVYFTHREEPPVVAAALGLFNSSSSPGPWADIPNEGEEDGWDWRGWEERAKDRLWRTSELIPFLGHLALERLECVTPHSDPHPRSDSPDHSRAAEEGETKPHVRVLVNETPQRIPACDSGPGGSCPLDQFLEYVATRSARFGDFDEQCNKKQ